MKKVQVILALLVAAAILGACSKDDYQDQLNELRRLNNELRAKIVEVDGKVIPEDTTVMKKSDAEAAIDQLKYVIVGLRKEVRILFENSQEHEGHLTDLDDALAALRADATKTDADLRKLESVVQTITTNMGKLVTRQQLRVTLKKISERQKKTEDNVAALKKELRESIDEVNEALYGEDGDAGLRGELETLRSQVESLEEREQLRAARERLQALIRKIQSAVQPRIDDLTKTINQGLRDLRGLLGRALNIRPFPPPVMPPAED